MIMMARTVAERAQAGTRQQVEQDDYVAYIHKKTDGLAAIIIADKEYPDRVAFTFASKVVMDYSEKQKGVSVQDLRRPSSENECEPTPFVGPQAVFHARRLGRTRVSLVACNMLPDLHTNIVSKKAPAYDFDT